MPQNKTSGKITGDKIEHRGRITNKTIAQDSVSGGVPAGYVRPKATQTPAKPTKKD